MISNTERTMSLENRNWKTLNIKMTPENEKKLNEERMNDCKQIGDASNLR